MYPNKRFPVSLPVVAHSTFWNAIGFSSRICLRKGATGQVHLKSVYSGLERRGIGGRPWEENTSDHVAEQRR